MQYYTVIATLLFFNLIILCQSIKFNHELDEYLMSQSMNLDSEGYKGIKKWDDPITINFGQEEDILLDEGIVHSFTIKNETYIVGSTQSATPKLKIFPKSSVSGLKPIKLFSYDQKNFLSVIQANGTLDLFDVKPRGLVKIQTINFNVSVVEFIVFEDELFLVMGTFNSHDMHGDLILFKWAGTYFDISTTLVTKNILNLSVYATSQELIIITQDTEATSIYEYKYQKLKKIQKILTIDPLKISTQSHQNKKYLIIFEKSGHHNIYQWRGSHFTKIFSFSIPNKILASSFLNTDLPIFAVLDDEKLWAFNLNDPEFKVEKVINLKDFKIVVADFINPEKGYIITVNGAKKFKMINFEIPGEIKGYKPEESMHLEKCLNDLKMAVSVGPQGRSMTVEKIHTGSKTGAAFGSKLRLQKHELSLDELNHKYENVKRAVDGIELTSNHVTLKNITKVNLLEAENLLVNNVTLRKFNNRTWEPENWLSYEDDQHISGHFKVENLNVETLSVFSRHNIFTDMLLKGMDNPVFHALITVDQIEMEDMKARTINNILVDDIFVRNTAISGVKTFENIVVREAKIKNINEDSADTTLSMFTDSDLKNFAPMVEIENLWVEEIDDINWNNFRDSVFRNGETKTIQGNIKFNKLVTDKLKAKTINGVKVEDFMTTTTDQIIDSDIRFNNIFTNNLFVDRLNAIPFDNYATIPKNETQVIQGLVRLNKLDVNNKLDLIGDFASLYMKEGSEIIGTDKSHLLQIYNNEVIVKGDVHVNNITLLDNVKLFLSQEHFDLDFSKYWSKSSHQRIDAHITAEEGLTTTNLATNMINGINFNKFMLNNASNHEETKFFFEKVTIHGNLILDPSQIHSPNFKLLDTHGVKVNGNFIIEGKKHYANVLKVEQLSAEGMLGPVHTLDALTVEPNEITGKKTFENIIVKNNVDCGTINVDVINDIPVKEYFDDVVFINKDMKGANMSFDDVSVMNLYAETINGNNMDEHISQVNNLMGKDVIENLYIDGEAKFDKLVDVSKINNIGMEDMSGPFKKPVRFSSKVKVKNFVVRTVNDVDLKELTSNLFYRNENQNVTAVYSFKNLKASNLYTSRINNISFSDILDVNNNYMISADVRFVNSKLEILQGQSMHPCELSDVFNYINMPSSQAWRNINVFGDVSFLDETDDINRILYKTVQRGYDNIITAPVTFNGDLIINTIRSEIRELQGVDLQMIMEDAVLKYSEELQVIDGFKIFPSMYLNSVEIIGNADIPEVNGVLVKVVDSSIVSVIDDDTVITGRKTFFDGVQAKKISCNIIGNINPEKLVTMNGSMETHAMFESVKVLGDLNIIYLNDMELNYVLNNRLYSESPEVQYTDAKYFFNNLEFTDGLITRSINDIDVDNIVVDSNVQNIQSKKVFTKDVEIMGNSTIGYVNGIPLSETYDKMLRLSEVGNITGSVTVMKPTKMMGSIDVKSINGVPWHHIIDVLQSRKTESRVNSLYVDKNAIMRNINNIYDLTQNLPSDYMYIEESKILDMHAPNIVNTKTVETSGDVLIHITTEESGESCGLPSYCKCPSQQTIQMTPEHSIQNLFNKGVQRIYTYSDDEMVANVITNSISTDSDCRNNATAFHEVTSLTWSTMPTPSRNGSFYMYEELIRGYVSGVEFFMVDNITYAFIGLYYDPLVNTHNINSRVVKFNADKTSLTTIQYIPSKGTKTVYLFHTAQGIILILGNTYTSDMKTEETEIYRFNIEKEKFELLRTIPSYGCSAASGVVLNRDNLIILAHREAPIIVLKYNPVYDNYEFYQSFQIDGSVKGISVFYTGGKPIGFGISDAYLCIVSEDEHYYIYSFQFIAGWKMENSGELEGLQKLIPFDMGSESYLLAPTKSMSTLFNVVKHGLK